jgi:CHASE2 domain-containing sensor protein
LWLLYEPLETFTFMWKKLIRPYPAIVTVFVFLVIGLLSVIQLNLHFLDPINHGIKDYEITDIVYSRMRSSEVRIEDRIVIVNTGRPDRALLAEMLGRITAVRPKVIGIDVLLSGRKDPSVDSLLQIRILQAGNTVFASTLENYREDLGYFQAETGIDTFFGNYTLTGFANFPINETQTIRLFSPREMTSEGPVNSFAFQIARQYDPDAAERLLKRKKELERIHFSTNEDSYVQFEPETILDTTVDLSALLRGKIVLLGYNGAYQDDCPMLDKFYTPFNPRYTGRSLPDMYGIVIHANIIRMMLDGKYVHVVPGWLSFLLALAYCYVNILVLEWIRHRYPRLYHPITRVLQIVEFALLFFIIALVFYLFRLKWDFSLGVLALALYFDVLLSYEGLSRTQLPWINRLPKAFLKNKSG